MEPKLREKTAIDLKIRHEVLHDECLQTLDILSPKYGAQSLIKLLGRALDTSKRKLSNSRIIRQGRIEALFDSLD